MKCDQCNSATINGVFTHEWGCPNREKDWDPETGQWRARLSCIECQEEFWEGDEHSHDEFVDEAYELLLASQDTGRFFDDFTEQEIMEAEAEMEIKMLLPAAGFHCDYHPSAPAVKRIRHEGVMDDYSTIIDLCAACCENMANALLAGIKSDPVQLQAEMENDR